MQVIFPGTDTVTKEGSMEHRHNAAAGEIFRLRSYQKGKEAGGMDHPA